MGRMHESGLDRRAIATEASQKSRNPNGLAHVVELSKKLNPHAPYKQSLFPQLTFTDSVVPRVSMLASEMDEKTRKDATNVVTKYFGAAGHILMKRTDLSEETREKLALRAKKRLKRKLVEDFPDTGRCPIPDMAMERSARTLDTLHRTLRPDIRNPIRTEITNNNDPVRGLELASANQQSAIVPREARQQLVFAYAGIAYESLDHQSAQKTLDKVQEIIGNLFDESSSEQEEYIVRVAAHNTTNKILAVLNNGDALPQKRNYHIKEIPFYVRNMKCKVFNSETKQIEEKELKVFVEYDRKKPESAFLKMGRRGLEAKAKGKVDIFDPSVGKDNFRLQAIVVNGGRDDAKGVLTAINDALIDHHPEITDIDPDSQTDDPNSKKDVSFERIIVSSQNTESLHPEREIKTEVKAIGIEDYLNGEMSVGTFDNQLRGWQGEGHPLYAIDRVESVGTLVNPNITRDVLQRTRKGVVIELRNRHRV